MTHGLFEQKVKLTEDHQYLDQDGQKYMGFSSFCHEFLCKEFNSSGAAYGVAKSAINRGEMTTAQQVLDKWEAQKILGVKIDKLVETGVNIVAENQEIIDVTRLSIDCAEEYNRNNEVKVELPNIEGTVEMIKGIIAEYKDYHSVYNQLIVYNENYLTGGAIDKMGMTSNRKDSQFELGDLKVFVREDNLHEHLGWFKSPMNHLSYTKVNKINWQLTYYAYQLEMLTGKRCKKLFIHLVNPITQFHRKIVLPYLKNDLILLLETNKDKIKELLAERKTMDINELI